MPVSQLSDTTLIDPEALDGAFAIHVRHKDRWLCATRLDSLREAELVAESAHRRSGLPIEVRSATGAILLAFEPACVRRRFGR